MEKTLEYYFEDGSREHFEKYTVDTFGAIRNKQTGNLLSTSKINTYNIVGVSNDAGKRRTILISRAVASTFHGKPPTLEHTVDHIDRDKNNNTLENIRWLCKTGQRNNQERPETYKTAFIIVKGGIEKTSKEWVVHLKDQKNPYGREYTEEIIRYYARKKHHGFTYKKYLDLPNEVWKKISGSDNNLGQWEISDMNRVKYVKKYAEHVISGEHICRSGGYPMITINGKHRPCHILSFIAFFPEDYASKKSGEIILHENDDRADFRPHKLRLGTRSDNATDAHNNGKYDGTKSVRMKCASYIDGVFEKEHNSQHDAVIYLKKKGILKASQGNIGRALDGTYKTAYGRTWQLIT